MSPPDAPRSGTRRLLLVIAAIVALMCVAFGYAIVQQQGSFRAYRTATLETVTPPWRTERLEPEACVRFAIDWGMACPGLGTWCESEAPRLVTECMASHDRSAYCQSLGETVGSTEFGYADCTRLRAEVTGKHTQRSHKKFCAAGYRAIAQHCRSAR